MNRTARAPDGNVDRLIDLLVDGELSDGMRRELLGRLDNEPDGWRRCALAFLEGQCWRQELRGEALVLASEPVPTVGTEVVTPSRTGRRWRAPSWRSVLALAATFLVAFYLGFAACRLKQPTEVARFLQRPTSDPQHKPDVDTTSATPESGAKVLAAESDGPVPASIKAVGLLTLSTQQDGKELAYALPVIESPGIDANWLQRQPLVVSDSARRTLESMGHQIVEHRELINIPLEDGRHVVVPVDQVKVRLASRVYQ